MDKLIKKISEIEASASLIMDGVNDRKAAFSEEMRKRTADFDAGLEADTASKLDALRSELEQDLKSRLVRQEAEAGQAIEKLNASYELHHKQYAQKLFQDMIKE